MINQTSVSHAPNRPPSRGPSISISMSHVYVLCILPSCRAFFFFLFRHLSTTLWLCTLIILHFGTTHSLSGFFSPLHGYQIVPERLARISPFFKFNRCQIWKCSNDLSFGSRVWFSFWSPRDTYIVTAIAMYVRNEFYLPILFSHPSTCNFRSFLVLTFVFNFNSHSLFF